MYCLTIVFGPAATAWTLMFKTKEAAETALKVGDDHVSVIDDFGQTIALNKEVVHGTMLEDMDLSKLAHIERGLHMARTQAEGNKIARSDPKLQEGARGPGIINPMGMMGNGRLSS